jgi:carbon storage regulator
MLVLTRKLGESIRIGDEVLVRVVEVQSGSVRLAIEAPREIAVHREEVWLQVQAENRRAAAQPLQGDPAALWRRSRGPAQGGQR